MTNFQKLVFYNHFNNGDIHVSREFIRQIMTKITKPEITFLYAHKNNHALIKDIPDLHHKNGLLQQLSIDDHYPLNGNSLYCNTWYGSKNREYLNRWGVSFDCLYHLFDDFAKTNLDFKLDDLSSDLKVFFPSINYTEYQIKEINTWLNNNSTKKKIFVSNGSVLSGQAENFSFGTILNRLVKNHKDVIFIYTSKDSSIISAENIIYSSDIIQKIDGSDLNENGYLSTFCDTIIGRASGPFSFAFNRDNLFKRKVKFVCLTNLSYKSKFWLGEFFSDKIDYSANFIISNEYDLEKVYNILEKNI